MKVKYTDKAPLPLIRDKVYEVLSIEYGYYRIVDETGNEYLYRSKFFEVVEEGDVPVIEYEEGDDPVLEEEEKYWKELDATKIRAGDRYACPVCCKYEFEYAGNFDICPVCGWEEDIVQLEEPDEDGANCMSLNQARRAYARGLVALIKANKPYPGEEDDEENDLKEE